MIGTGEGNRTLVSIHLFKTTNLQAIGASTEIWKTKPERGYWEGWVLSAEVPW